jgi:hypothetical protein
MSSSSETLKSSAPMRTTSRSHSALSTFRAAQHWMRSHLCLSASESASHSCLFSLKVREKL